MTTASSRASEVERKSSSFRYGREEMLAMYAPDLPVPTDLQDMRIFCMRELLPMSFLPVTEDEQTALLKCVNSDLAVNSSLRGGAPPVPQATRTVPGVQMKERGRGDTSMTSPKASDGTYGRSETSESVGSLDWRKEKLAEKTTTMSGASCGRGGGGGKGGSTAGARVTSSKQVSDERRCELNSRYHKLRQRHKLKRERQDAAFVDSTDVPGYKGNLDMEELLSYINGSKSLGHRSESHGGIASGAGRSAEKAGRRRKKGSNGSEKPDRTESGSKSMDRRTGAARVDSSAIKANNERARVISPCKLMNCVDAVSDDKTVAGDVCREQKVGCREQKVGDVLTSQTIGDSDLALHVFGDKIPQGNMDSIRTAAVDQPHEKSLAPSSCLLVLRSMSADVSMQSAWLTDDGFTMVTKKKMSKKSSSKRGKPPCSDCLRCVLLSSDSTVPMRFCERSSKLNLPQHQPFFSRQDDFRSEGSTGDCLFRGNPLHASGLRGYDTPQYHLTRFDFSSKFEWPSLASSRYYQARQRRQSKRERQDAAVVNSAKERTTVTSTCQLDCVDVVSNDETVPGDVRREQKVGDVLTSQTIGDSDLALRVVCDNIPQGNMDSIRTVTVVQSLEKSRTPSGSFLVPRAMSADIPLQRAASNEDDFTMVMKNKKSKKGNSKRGKPPRSDCPMCVPVSRDSTVSTSAERDFFSPLAAASKESASFSGYQTKNRSSALSKSSSAFRPSTVAKTVNKDAGFYLDDAEEDDWLAGEIETEVENDYGKAVVAVPAVTAVQIMPAAAPESGESNTDDSGAGTSNFLLSRGKPTLHSGEKPEPTAKASLESVGEEVAEEKQRSSKRPLAAKSKDLSVEKLEMSPSRWQQNVSQDDVTKPQSLSQDENMKPVTFWDRKLHQFYVPVKKELGLRFGFIEDFECDTNESRGTPPPPPHPSPVSVIRYRSVLCNDEDGGHDKPLPDSNAMMFPIPHQYSQQLMYPYDPLQPLCESSFQVYPSGHLFPVPMQFAPPVPPGFCVFPPRTADVSVGTVLPTRNNGPREKENLSTRCAHSSAIITDGSDTSVASFHAVVPTELIVQAPLLQPVPVLANVALSRSYADECCRSKNECRLDSVCLSKPGTYTCSCRLGTKTTADGRGCEDIDECQISGPFSARCQGTCTNTDGSFKCTCFEGFRLGNDSRTCLPSYEGDMKSQREVRLDHVRLANAQTDDDGSPKATGERTAGHAGCTADIDECCGSEHERHLDSVCRLRTKTKVYERRCEDTDECQISGPFSARCQGTCTNTDGSFQRTCLQRHSSSEDESDEVNKSTNNNYSRKKRKSNISSDWRCFHCKQQNDIDYLTCKKCKKLRTTIDVLQPPLWWESCLKSLPVQRVLLDTTDKRCLELLKTMEGCEPSQSLTFLSIIRWLLGLPEPDKTTSVTSVESIQNLHQWQMYTLEKQQLELENGTGIENEMSLYHGTTAEAARNIIRYGFDKAYAGQHGSLFGQGLYFTNDISIAGHEDYAAKDADGFQCIIVASVLTGRFTEGSRDLLEPPLLPDGAGRYNCVVDDVSDPEIFVIFSQYQAIPQYIITFKVN